MSSPISIAVGKAAFARIAFGDADLYIDNRFWITGKPGVSRNRYGCGMQSEGQIGPVYCDSDFNANALSH